MKTLYMLSFLLLFLSFSLSKRQVHRAQQNSTKLENSSNVSNASLALNSSVDHCYNTSQRKIDSFVSLLNYTANRTENETKTLMKDFFLMMYISKTNCFAQAALGHSFHEMKTQIHRSFWDYFNTVISVAGVIMYFLLSDVPHAALTNWEAKVWDDHLDFLEWTWKNKQLA